MKKNQIKMMLVAGLVVLAAACEKQPVNSEIVSGNVVTIKASVEGSGTKAKIAESDAKFSWTAGDQISVHTSTGYKDSEALTAGGSASADFTFTSLSDEGRTGFAVYPASIKNTTYYSSTDFRVNLPTEYKPVSCWLRGDSAYPDGSQERSRHGSVFQACLLSNKAHPVESPCRHQDDSGIM